MVCAACHFNERFQLRFVFHTISPMVIRQFNTQTADDFNVMYLRMRMCIPFNWNRHEQCQITTQRIITHSLIHSLTVRIHSFDQSFVRICKNLRARVNNSIAWVIYKTHLRGREKRENDDGARALFLKFSTEKRHNRWIAFWSAIMQFSLFGKHHKKFTNEKSTKETKRKMYVQSIDVRVLKKRLMNSY